MTDRKRRKGLTLMPNGEGFVDDPDSDWSIEDLRAEGLDVAYAYRDKEGRLWFRLEPYARIPPSNKRFDS
jgi:hypothetical protein